MYQLVLTSNSAQNSLYAIETFMTSLLAIFGGFMIIAIVVPIVITIAVQVGFGIITMSIAGKKGYNKLGFFWYGYFFFPIAVGVAILAPPIYKSGNSVAYTVQDEDELAKYEEMYEAGTMSWTQFCQKKEEIAQRKYRK